MVILASMTAFWSRRGHVASVDDSPEVWSLARASVRPEDPTQVVLLGASRMQHDIDLDEFARTFGGRKPIQLAVGGSTSIPVLYDLSGDASFRGLVICDLSSAFYVGGLSPDQGIQAEWVRYYHTKVGSGGRSVLPLLEARLRGMVQRRVVVRLPNLSPTAHNVMGWTERGSLPLPDNRVMMMDRSQRADLRGLEPSVIRQLEELWLDRTQRSGYGPPNNIFTKDLRELEKAVERIQGRGGRVVFVAMPVDGPVRDAEEERMPRHKYWDALVSHTTATTIHFLDYPELSSFECPEGSHLDYRDATPFTAAFVRVLKRRLGAAL
jgi:hypothetical protein